MDHNLTVKGSVQINAPASKVWDALTNPEIIKLYLYGTETITDWQVGSDIIFQGEYQGHHYKDKGVVRVFNINQELSYAYWSGFSGLADEPANYSLVTYQLASDDAHTSLTWIQKGFSNAEGHKHASEGIQGMLATIKKIVEDLLVSH